MKLSQNQRKVLRLIDNSPNNLACLPSWLYQAAWGLRKRKIIGWRTEPSPGWFRISAREPR